MRSKFEAKKNMAKSRKKEANAELAGIDRWSPDGCRGDKEGEPSGYGGIPAKIPAKIPSGFRTTPSTPVGYGELII